MGPFRAVRTQRCFPLGSVSAGLMLAASLVPAVILAMAIVVGLPSVSTQTDATASAACVPCLPSGR